MPNDIPQGRVTVYTKKPLEVCQQTLGNEEQNKYNPIYVIPSATTKPLPATPPIKDAVVVAVAVEDEDETYDQCGDVNVYVIGEEPCNGNLEMVRNTTAINESPYLDMTTEIGLHTEIESCC
ncbi:MAG: hypothetical protein QMO91_03645 [Candidatus Tisiphia sp.]|nr:hypothetical protein [Candidatus Tisiphia sp.]